MKQIIVPNPYDNLNSEIPEWQKELTLSRLDELEKDPSKAIDFNAMLDRLADKHGL
jgi:hypothetical protein